MLQQISIDTARQLIREKSPVIFDMRDSTAYSDARIPNAIHATLPTLQSSFKKVHRNVPVLVYCYRGCASADLAHLFTEYGFGEVYILEGGFHAWHLSGAEIERPAKNRAVVRLNPVSDWLLDQGGDPEDLNGPLPCCDTPPLIKACQQGLADIAEGLIAAGADISRVDAYGNDALWAACYSGDLRTIDLLIAAGAHLNHRNSVGATSLIYAASTGKAEIVARLLEAGADPAIKTQDDYTALDLASNLETLRLLRRPARPLPRRSSAA
jgi:thiosulfate/3-mercaptopyruvate sulfurtransferase